MMLVRVFHTPEINDIAPETIALINAKAASQIARIPSTTNLNAAYRAFQ